MVPLDENAILVGTSAGSGSKGVEWGLDGM